MMTIQHLDQVTSMRITGILWMMCYLISKISRYDDWKPLSYIQKKAAVRDGLIYLLYFFGLEYMVFETVIRGYIY